MGKLGHPGSRGNKHETGYKVESGNLRTEFSEVIMMMTIAAIFKVF